MIAEQTLPDLMNVLEFTADDLAANREGQMSEHQQSHFAQRRQRTMIIGFALWWFIVVGATLLIFLGTRDNGSAVLALIGIGLTICGAAMGGIIGRHWMRLNADLCNGQVQSVSGGLERVLKPLNNRVIYYMVRVGQAEIYISKEAFEAFEHGAIYTLYRAPYTGALLSAERM